jgi:hypothetical protein
MQLAREADTYKNNFCLIIRVWNRMYHPVLNPVSTGFLIIRFNPDSYGLRLKGATVSKIKKKQISYFVTGP